MTPHIIVLILILNGLKISKQSQIVKNVFRGNNLEKDPLYNFLD